ncbi:MAG: hypothetical protein KF684_12790 [Phycisphaeraceae bacterium]|nr:hypothetical protein [Phycisphaeraceae bacterium]
MAATSIHFERKYSRGFRLDAEAIKKIDQFFRDDLGTGDELKYRVHLANDSVVEFGEAVDVVGLENGNADRITKIELLATMDGGTKFEISLGSVSGVRVMVEGKHRAELESLLRRVTDYLERDIISWWPPAATQFGIRVFIGIGFLAFMVLLLGSLAVRMVRGEVDVIVQSLLSAREAGDHHRMIEAMIDDRIYHLNIRGSRLYGWSSLLFILFIIASAPAASLAAIAIKFLFPRNVFVWGREIHRIAKRAQIRAWLFSGLGLGIVASLIAGALVRLF